MPAIIGLDRSISCCYRRWNRSMLNWLCIQSTIFSSVSVSPNNFFCWSISHLKWRREISLPQILYCANNVKQIFVVAHTISSTIFQSINCPFRILFVFSDRFRWSKPRVNLSLAKTTWDTLWWRLPLLYNQIIGNCTTCTVLLWAANNNKKTEAKLRFG